MSWAVRDDLSDAVLSGGDMWFASCSLWHFSFLGLARIRLHRRMQSRNEWLHKR